jgi:hypothetical protein
VVAVGDDQHHRWKVGDRAGIKWVASTCGECEVCTNGTDELHCPNQKNSGFSAAGTFQEYALADGRYTTRIPDGVSDEEAGPIMCGGVTAYVACKRSAVKPGQWIARIFLPISSACADSSRSFPVQGVGWVISPYSMPKPWSVRFGPQSSSISKTFSGHEDHRHRWRRREARFVQETGRGRIHRFHHNPRYRRRGDEDYDLWCSRRSGDSSDQGGVCFGAHISPTGRNSRGRRSTEGSDRSRWRTASFAMSEEAERRRQCDWHNERSGGLFVIYFSRPCACKWQAM